MSFESRAQRAFDINKFEKRGDWWRPKPGENVIRIFPFNHTVTEGDFKLGRYLTGEVKVGAVESELFCVHRQHFRQKEPYTCGLLKLADKRMVGRCDSCETASELRKSKLKEDQEAARRASARIGYVLNILDVDAAQKGEAPKFRAYTAPQTVLDFIVSGMNSRLTKGRVLFGATGTDLLLTFDKDAHASKMYSLGWLTGAEDSKPIDVTKVGGKILDFYSVKEYVPEEFRPLISAAEKEEPAEEPAATKPVPSEPKAEPPRRRGRPPKAKEPEPKVYGIGDEVTFKDGDELLKGTITGEENGKFIVGLDLDGEMVEYDVGPAEILTYP